MKTIPILALLSLSLAACSQSTLPGATGAPSSPILGAGTGPVYMDTQATYDALALKQLGTQALTAKTYLSVAPVVSNPDSVRAYVRTTFASPVTTTLDWGDGGAPATIGTPTTTRIETRDHAYAVFGSYTVTLSSVNAGVVVDTRVFTVQAGKKASSSVVVNFDSPAPAPAGFTTYARYSEQGYDFTPVLGEYVYQLDPGYAGGQLNLGSSVGLYYQGGRNMTMTAGDNSLFTLKSFDTRDVNPGLINDFNVTGYKQDGTVLTARTAEVVNDKSTLTLGADWTNLTRVAFGDDDANYKTIVIDNVAISR